MKFPIQNAPTRDVISPKLGTAPAITKARAQYIGTMIAQIIFPRLVVRAGKPIGIMLDASRAKKVRKRSSWGSRTEEFDKYVVVYNLYPDVSI